MKAPGLSDTGKLQAKVQILEKHNQELIVALDQHRLVIEHYLNICASVGADPAPAKEVMMKYARMNVTPPSLRSVK